MGDDFIIKPRDEETTQISIRIEKRIMNSLEELATKSGKSCNQIINESLDYAVKKARLADENEV